jgi:metal-responsive CopG/Arc/MetJ family transcriptional regulator
MRVQVNLSDEMVSKVDMYARKMGVSRSALCSMLVGQGIMGYDKSMDLLSLIGDKVGDSLLAEKTLKEVANETTSK